VNEKTEYMVGQPGWVSASAMAEVSGLAALEKTTHLLVHARYGPWFSLRSVLIFDSLSGDALTQGEPPHLHLSDEVKRELERLMHEAKAGVLSIVQLHTCGEPAVVKLAHFLQ
jgi:hypothetical protein